MKIYKLLSKQSDGNGFTSDVVAAASMVEAIAFTNECNEGFKVYSANLVEDVEYVGECTTPKCIWEL